MPCPTTIIGPPGPSEAPTMAITGSLKVNSNWQVIEDADFGSPVERKRHRITYSWRDGDDANEIQELYHARRTILLGSLYEDLDLSGELANVFQQTVEFATIRALIIYNRAETVGEDLLVGGAGVVAHAWSAPFNGDAYGVWKIRALGGKVVVAPLDGFAVVAGSSAVLRVMHAGVGTSISYDIILKGTVP